MSPKSRARKPNRAGRPRSDAPHGADHVHAGRVTSPRAATSPSARYTPPARTRFRVRPAWHKAAGVTVIVAGAALFFTWRFNGWGIHRFGGHVWYLVGLTMTVSSLWWFGAFDRTPPPVAPRP